MDMLNQLQKLVTPDQDAETSKAVQTAYPSQEPTTPLSVLLERLLAQAEAMPQLPPLGAEIPFRQTEVEEAVCPVMTHDSTWLRYLVGKRQKATERLERVQRQRSRESYRARTEYNLRQAAGSALKPR